MSSSITNRIRILTNILILTVIITSCNHDKFNVDVSGIRIDLKIQRFENDLFRLKSDSLCLEIPGMERKYGEFFDLYSNKIISIGGSNSREYCNKLGLFLSDAMITDDYRKCMLVFPTLDEQETKLTLAFKHYKYYFPDKPVPEVYSYVGGFNQSVVTAGDFIGIGLDKYLGRDCDFYVRMDIPAYARSRMQQDFIVTDCMTAWAIAEFEYFDSIDNVATNLVYNGKIMYLLDALLPGAPDSIKIAYTGKQLEWCKKNEKKMWTSLVENKLIFSSEYMDIKRLFNEGPFTATFSNNSPARTGTWIGWQIVRSYMKNNPGISLPMLMKDNDYLKILNHSKYNP
ncbi:MAG: hypothetical protein NTW49_08250 [Bacteroidia bacterium]|nr:hypothetical protein [Bacteroidia bacterium]